MHKEDFSTVSAAAIHGGVVQVADMPNNPVAPVDDARYTAKEALTRKAEIHMTLYAGIGPGTEPLARHVPYKAFMGPSVGDLFFTSRTQLENTIARYRGRNVSFHCEDPEILEAHRGARTHERVAPRPPKSRPRNSPFSLSRATSSPASFAITRRVAGCRRFWQRRARGLRVTCEVTPHHLFFDTSMLTEENRLLLQMNPPLRAPEDRLALIEALRRGEIDYIATDHAPHTLDEKARGTSGVPHLDTYGAFATWLMVEHGFTAQDIARVCAYNPGRFVREFLPARFGEGFGHVAPGYFGSLTMIDPHAPWTVERGSIRSKCGWSPFEGFTFPGSVRATILGGRVYT